MDSEPVYGDSEKYIKTKIKSYRDKIYTKFQDKKIPEENASYRWCIDNVRFCYQKVLAANTFGRVKIWNKKE